MPFGYTLLIQLLYLVVALLWIMQDEEKNKVLSWKILEAYTNLIYMYNHLTCVTHIYDLPN